MRKSTKELIKAFNCLYFREIASVLVCVAITLSSMTGCSFVLDSTVITEESGKISQDNNSREDVSNSKESGSSKNNKNSNNTSSSKDDVSSNDTTSSEDDIGSSSSKNNSSKNELQPNSSNSSSNDLSVDYTDDFMVTGTAVVSDDTCVVVGYCPKNTKKIIVSGVNVVKTEIAPFDGQDKKYFMGQVKFTSSSDMNFKVVDKTGNTLVTTTEFVYYRPIDGNQMYTGEYVPVFSNDSRIHFYSALLSYSLTTSKFTQSMRNAAEQNIGNYISAAKDVGAEPIFLIIPTSCDIYPESVPSGFSEAKGTRLFNEFKKIAEAKGAKVIYPLDTMKAHKNDGVGYQIYQHTDSHWSTYGAYWGTYDLFNYISKKFPNAKPRSLSEMGFYTREMNGGDALFNLPNGLAFEKNRKTGDVPNSNIRELTTLYSLNMPTSTLKSVYHSNQALYLGDNNSAANVVTNNSGTGLPTAVIMRDSFGKVSYDMMNDRFSKVYWGEFDNYVLPKQAIKESNADYIIYLYSERNLLKIMLGNSSATMLNLK